MYDSEKKIQVPFRCPEEMHNRLKDEAERRGVSMNVLINTLIARFLDEAEGAQDVDNALRFSESERKFLEDALFALRAGEPELVRSLEQLVKSMVLIANKRKRERRRMESERKAG